MIGGLGDRDIWAVLPVKETVLAKQRLANVLSPRLRQELATAMFEDVMQALAGAPGLAGIAVVTLDPKAREIASRWGAEVWTDARARGTHRCGNRCGASGGSKRIGNVDDAGDIPLVSPADVAQLLIAHSEAPAFTIAPAWDERGSNAIVCSPADLVPLRFGSAASFRTSPQRNAKA